MANLVIKIDLGKRCLKCRKPGAVNDTGLCIECLAKRIPQMKMPRPRPEARKGD